MILEYQVNGDAKPVTRCLLVGDTRGTIAVIGYPAVDIIIGIGALDNGQLGGLG